MVNFLLNSFLFVFVIVICVRLSGLEFLRRDLREDFDFIDNGSSVAQSENNSPMPGLWLTSLRAKSEIISYRYTSCPA